MIVTVSEIFVSFISGLIRGTLYGIILCAALMIIAFALSEVKRIVKKRKKQKEQERQKFTHPPMDLRLKHDPCDCCNRWSECNGVDKDICPRWENEN